jgi:hypothetical protein
LGKRRQGRKGQGHQAGCRKQYCIPDRPEHYAFYSSCVSVVGSLGSLAPDAAITRIVSSTAIAHAAATAAASMNAREKP